MYFFYFSPNACAGGEREGRERRVVGDKLNGVRSETPTVRASAEGMTPALVLSSGTRPRTSRGSVLHSLSRSRPSWNCLIVKYVKAARRLICNNF